MIDSVKVGKELCRLRKQMGLTQEKLAKEINVSFQAVSNWERGKTPPTLDNLVELSDYFGVSVDSLLRGDGEEYYIGADAGGVKTEFVLFTSNGKVVKRLILGPSNPYDVGVDASKRVILEGVETLLRVRSGIKAAFIGLAGAGPDLLNDELQSFFAKKSYSVKVSVDSDTHGVFAMADADVALVSGTGVVTVVKQNFAAIGGWGAMFDESGGGYDVAKDAFRACMFYQDGFGEKTSLYDRIKEILLNGSKNDESFSLRDYLKKIYEGGKRYVASFAPVVIQEYCNGDKVAVEIIEKNVKHIATLLKQAISRAHSNRVVVSGGFITNNRSVLEPLIKKYVSAQLIFCDLPPVYGACLVCLNRIGVKASDDFKENFQKTYDHL